MKFFFVLGPVEGKAGGVVVVVVVVGGGLEWQLWMPNNGNVGSGGGEVESFYTSFALFYWLCIWRNVGSRKRLSLFISEIRFLYVSATNGLGQANPEAPIIIGK